MIGHRKSKSAAAVFGLLALVALATGLGWAVEPSRLINADKDPNSWLSYNGTYYGGGEAHMRVPCLRSTSLSYA